MRKGAWVSPTMPIHLQVLHNLTDFKRPPLARRQSNPVKTLKQRLMKKPVASPKMKMKKEVKARSNPPTHSRKDP